MLECFNLLLNCDLKQWHIAFLKQFVKSNTDEIAMGKCHNEFVAMHNSQQIYQYH